MNTPTIVPTQAQVAAFKEAWDKADKAGLEGLRTVIGLTAALNIATPPRPVIKLVDNDNDTWVPVSPGQDAWVSPEAGLTVPRSREWLTEHYGPLTEVHE